MTESQQVSLYYPSCYYQGVIARALPEAIQGCSASSCNCGVLFSGLLRLRLAVTGSLQSHRIFQAVIIRASLRVLCPKQSSTVATSGCHRGAMFSGLLRLRLAMTKPEGLIVLFKLLLSGRHCEGSARSNPVLFRFSVSSRCILFWIASPPAHNDEQPAGLIVLFKLLLLGRHCEGSARSNPGLFRFSE